MKELTSNLNLHSAAILFFLALFFSVPYTYAEKPDFGDAIVTASISDALTLVPILASDTASSEVCGMVYNGLVKYDKDVKIIGDLAENWDISEDGKLIVFHLRKDVRWHDGHPFTSKDVEFTYRKLIDKSVKTPYSAAYERVEMLDTPDDYTVKIKYKESFAPALSSWGMWIMPEHLLKNEDLSNTKYARCPVGTGPYKFKSWKTGEKIELIANRDYFEHRPYLDRYIIRIIPDESTVFLELQVQGVDLALLSPLQFTKQTDTPFFRAHFNKFKYPSFSYTYIGFNLTDPRFQDVRVRRAIDLAINKKEIMDTVFFGLAEGLSGPFLKQSWAYDKNIAPTPYDPVAARAMLADCGWADTDGDGWIDMKGKRFTFTLLVNQGNGERIKSAELVQRYLSAVGIKMDIRVLEWSAMISEFIGKRRFDAILMGWFLPRDPDNFDVWHSSRTVEGGFNFIGYKNSEVDSLLEEGRSIFVQSKRASIYRRIHRLIYDDRPCVFLYTQDLLPVVNNRFRGVENSAIGIGYNIIDWYVPKDKQKYGR